MFLRFAQALLLAAVAASAMAAETAPSTTASLVERSALALRADPEAARRLADQALVALVARPDPDLEIRARLVLCEYNAERNVPETESQIEAIEALLASAKRTGLRAGLLNCRGEMLETQGENGPAAALYSQAVSTAEASRDQEMLAGALYSRGYLLGLQGDFANGLVDLRRSQALYDTLKMPHHSITALNAIAITYNRMGDYSQAQSIFTRALEVQRGEGLRREQAVTEHNLGRVAENLGQWNRARIAFESSLANSRDIGYRRGEGYALRGLAAVALARGDAAAALASLDAASQLQRQTPDARLGSLIALTRGMALRAVGSLKESRASLLAALETFRKGSVQGDLAIAYNELAAVDADLGEWRRAYQWKEAAKATSERLLRNQIDQRFATLKVEFDTVTKEKEYQALLQTSEANGLALKQTQRARKLQYAVIGLTALLATLLATLAYYQRRSSLRMQRLAMTDELTEAPNRRAVLAQLPDAISSDDHQPVSVIIIDIDHFKSINDDFGHGVGDQVLRIVAQRLRATLPSPHFCGRIGGEEFLVVLRGATAAEAIIKAEALRLDMMQIDTNGLFAQPRAITASIGVTTSIAGDTHSAMLQRADAALYRAKRAGRNRVFAESTRQAGGVRSAEVEALRTSRR
ncbi:MAG TPA: tetratricopeptide repeat-containing diguanylate cyclase [Steroidobacteraceae bacterium]|nr:tetratricopeptide repeat-containing diguanylate cyclase [Steroidobacteraceae bacterium]